MFGVVMCVCVGGGGGRGLVFLCFLQKERGGGWGYPLFFLLLTKQPYPFIF